MTTSGTAIPSFDFTWKCQQNCTCSFKGEHWIAHLTMRLFVVLISRDLWLLDGKNQTNHLLTLEVGNDNWICVSLIEKRHWCLLFFRYEPIYAFKMVNTETIIPLEQTCKCQNNCIWLLKEVFDDMLVKTWLLPSFKCIALIKLINMATVTRF